MPFTHDPGARDLRTPSAAAPAVVYVPTERPVVAAFSTYQREAARLLVRRHDGLPLHHILGEHAAALHRAATDTQVHFGTHAWQVAAVHPAAPPSLDRLRALDEAGALLRALATLCTATGIALEDVASHDLAALAAEEARHDEP